LDARIWLSIRSNKRLIDRRYSPPAASSCRFSFNCRLHLLLPYKAGFSRQLNNHTTHSLETRCLRAGRILKFHKRICSIIFLLINVLKLKAKGVRQHTYRVAQNKIPQETMCISATSGSDLKNS